MADGLAERKILAVEIGYQSGTFHLELPGFGIDITFVDHNVYHLGDKHVVRAERNDVPDAAFDRDRSLGYDRGLHHRCRHRRQAHLGKLVVITSRTDAAPVCGTCKLLGSEIYDKLPVSLYYVIRMSLGAYRDVAHCRIAAHRSRPRHRKYIVFIGCGTAAYKHGRQRIYHGSGSPILFHSQKKLVIQGKDTYFASENLDFEKYCLSLHHDYGTPRFGST